MLQANAKSGAPPLEDDRGDVSGGEQADRRYLFLLLAKKLTLAVMLGIVAYAGCGLFTYFPAWWQKGFVVLIVFVSIRFIRLAVLLTMGVLAVPLLYQSMPLGVLYITACIGFLLLFWWFEFFPEAFLLIVSTPLWASMELMGVPLPLYFLPVFLGGIWARGAWASIIPALACIAACVTGMVVQAHNIGPLLVGSAARVKLKAIGKISIFWPYDDKPVPANFFDFGWVSERLGLAMSHADVVVAYVNKIFASLGQYPFMLIEIGIWAVAGYFVGKLLSQRSLPMDLAGIGVGVAAGVASPYALQALFPEKAVAAGISPLAFVLPAVFAFVMVGLERTLRDTGEQAERVYDKAVEAHAEQEYQKALALYNAQVAQARAEAEARGEVYDEQEQAPPPPPKPQKQSVSLENLNLQDTIKLQMHLNELMEKKFAQECSVIDVDVAGSVKLKDGAKPETILYSFGQFHKFMDESMMKFGGRLMDRAGDGIIYSFHGPGNADNVLAAAKYALRHLEEFNRTRNKFEKDFVVRLGINSGTIIKDENTEKGMTFSPVIDIAGHLQKAAQPNGLNLSRDTYERLENKAGLREGGQLAKNNVVFYVLE